MFIQAPCLMPSKHYHYRQISGLAIACLGVFIYMFSLSYFEYLAALEDTSYVDFDVKTITAADYTVEFNITPTQFAFFQEHFLDESNPMSEMAQFKLYVQEELEQRIVAMDDLGYDDQPDEDSCRIGQVTFAFFNEYVINALKDRGNLIMYQKWEKLEKLNQSIADKIKDQEILDRLQTPCFAFCTFESEEGYNRAIKINE